MTMAHILLTLELDELCESALAARGAAGNRRRRHVEPRERRGDTWLFDAAALTLVRRAARLQREFELDWPGIALAMRLLDEVEQLRAENRQLRQRLARYLED
jgi:chaperone modulatory protein CbpM